MWAFGPFISCQEAGERERTHKKECGTCYDLGREGPSLIWENNEVRKYKIEEAVHFNQEQCRERESVTIVGFLAANVPATKLNQLCLKTM